MEAFEKNLGKDEKGKKREKISFATKTVEEIVEAANRCKKEPYLPNVTVTYGNLKKQSKIWKAAKKITLYTTATALCLYIGAKNSEAILGVERYVRDKIISAVEYSNKTNDVNTLDAKTSDGKTSDGGR